MKWQKRKLILFGIAILFFSMFYFGYQMMKETAWIDKMLNEMEAALIEVEKTGGGNSERNAKGKAAVSLAARKYFPIGMPKQEAIKLFEQLKSDGFEVDEAIYEGVRKWPDGDFKPYRDAVAERNRQRRHKPGTNTFHIEKQYGYYKLIFAKKMTISIDFSDAEHGIIDLRADLWADAI